MKVGAASVDNGDSLLQKRGWNTLASCKTASTRCDRTAAPLDGGSPAHVENCCAFRKGVIINTVLDYCQECQPAPAG